MRWVHPSMAFFGLGLVLGLAGWRQAARPTPLPVSPCHHPVVLERDGRWLAFCQEQARVPLARVLVQAGVRGCAPAGEVEEGTLLRLAGPCQYRQTLLPARTRLTLGLRLDINQATAQELEALPRVGPALARRIVEDRRRRGSFGSTGELDRVRGIGPATVARLRDLIRVGGPPPAPVP